MFIAYRRLALVALLALLPAFASAELTGGRVRVPMLSDYDLDATTYTYCVTTGQGGDPLAQGRLGQAKIETSGSSTTWTASTTGQKPFDRLAVGDEITVKDASVPPEFITRRVTAKASGDSITVSSAADLGADGVMFTWRQRACGTTATSGWIPTEAQGESLFAIQIDQLNVTGGIDVSVECEVLSVGSDGTQVHTENVTAAKNISVNIESPYDRCRVGFKIGTADDGDDLTTNAEDITVNYRSQSWR